MHTDSCLGGGQPLGGHDLAVGEHDWAGPGPLVHAGPLRAVGILVAIPVAFLLKRTLLKGATPSFLVELPPYRLPQARAIGQAMWRNGKAFVVRAGSLILASSIVVWALSTFPQHPDPEAKGKAELERFTSAIRRKIWLASESG